MCCILTALISVILISSEIATGQMPAAEVGSGKIQKIPLSFFLDQEIQEREKKARNGRKPDAASYFFLKELLEERPIVLLSASWVTDDKREKIDAFCNPFITGATGFSYNVPGHGFMHGELEVKWLDAKVIHSFKNNKDLAYGGLVFEVKIECEKQEVATFSIKSNDRFVLFNQKTEAHRVYVFDEANESIKSLPRSRGLADGKGKKRE